MLCGPLGICPVFPVSVLKAYWCFLFCSAFFMLCRLSVVEFRFMAGKLSEWSSRQWPKLNLLCVPLLVCNTIFLFFRSQKYLKFATQIQICMCVCECGGHLSVCYFVIVQFKYANWEPLKNSPSKKIFEQGQPTVERRTKRKKCKFNAQFTQPQKCVTFLCKNRNTSNKKLNKNQAPTATDESLSRPKELGHKALKHKASSALSLAIKVLGAQKIKKVFFASSAMVVNRKHRDNNRPKDNGREMLPNWHEQ